MPLFILMETQRGQFTMSKILIYQKTSNMKKVSARIISTIAVILLLLSGCKKDGPATTDSIDPEMRLVISGGGINETFFATDDLSSGQLNLAPSTKYNFALTIADAGGVNLLKIFLSDALVNSDFELLSYPAATEFLGITYYTYTITIDAAHPGTTYTSYLISGSFTTPFTPNTDEGVEISCNGSDYTPNRVNIFVPALITETPAGGYGWVTF